MSSVSVRRFTEADTDAWDATVERSRTRHFFFRRGYLSYHSDRLPDASLLVHDGGRLVALLPATREGAIVTSHGGLTFGGLIGDEMLTTRRALEAMQAITAFLDETGATRLAYKPVPHIYHVIPAEEDLYALTALGARLVRRDVSSTIRSQNPGPRSKGRRAAIRQAAGAGIVVSASNRIAEFMKLECETLQRRHGVEPVHSPAEMELLAGRFPDEISLTTATREGELLAGVIVFETEVVAHAQYIAASPEGYEAHALDLVLDHLITERFSDKRFFDFGISTTEGGRVLNEGLIRNKESFGARATVYDQYELSLGTTSRGQ
jgi:hypothetical protein